MRKVLFVLLFALAVVPAASARNPHDQTEPSPSVNAVISPPTKVSSGTAATPAGATVAPAGTAVAAGDCGACITTCWIGATRGGPSDWSGHAWIIQHLNWCGNGAQITSASAYQTVDQQGWYQIQAVYGPWWSGGCVGCASVSTSGYMLWNWTAQLIGVSHSDTTNITSTMTAYGGLSV